MKKLLFLLTLLFPSFLLAENPYVNSADSAFLNGFTQGMGSPQQPAYQNNLERIQQQQLQQQILEQQRLQNLLLQQQLQQQRSKQLADWARMPESEPPSRAPRQSQRFRTNCVTIGNITTCN